MDAKLTSRLIDAVGGPTAFARLLGIDNERHFQQRINNWRHDGLPLRIQLDHQRTLRRLLRKHNLSAQNRKNQVRRAIEDAPATAGGA